MPVIGLVACSKAKATEPRAARDFYVSPLFRKCRDWCLRNCDRWFVLSALHGLVDPDEVLEPYDRTLCEADAREKRAWAEKVVGRIAELGLSGERFMVLAGKAYTDPLTPLLADCSVPLEGLGIGERLAWLKKEEKMGKTKNAGAVIEVPCLEIRQGKRTLWTFAVDGKRVHEFAAVSRVGRDDGGEVTGYQRPEVKAHVAGIRQYLETEGAILPNAVVVAFEPGVARFTPSVPAGKGGSRAGTLSIPVGDARKAGWIVDGQQRSAAVRDAALESFSLLVSAFEADEEEQREQFILVNSTKPLPKGLVFELLPGTDALLPDKLAKARFPVILLDRLNRDEDSPLKGKIRTPTCPDGTIVDSSILKMLGNSLTDGVLYPFTGQSPDIEAMLGVLKDFWSAVAGVFPEAWSRPPRLSRLTHGAGIVSLGMIMDAIADWYRKEGIPKRTRFVEELTRLSPYCKWTAESGDWVLDGFRRRWNEIQNTPKDVRLLADLLLKAYRRSLAEVA